ncbi:type II secretion system secretin GspD [Desulfocurvibacter africanus]|uniref:type II secretion system secretin GspD n=1 Tax=Desulfocurvibacter africanus TaxID=873 RepID=UPI001FCA83DB|nr:type II secretion system secretin GspD [Desulfocurvibacter africanus]
MTLPLRSSNAGQAAMHTSTLRLGEVAQRLVLAALLAGLILAVLPDSLQAQARPQAAQGQQNISMDFNGVDIQIFVKFISELTGRNFVMDDKVRGRVTVVSPRRISVDEAYKVFESVLAVYGFMAVPAGQVTKILPIRESPTTGLETFTIPRLDRYGDSFVTQLVQLNHVRVEDVLKMLAPMVSRSGLITAYAPSSMLIVTDSESNLRRLLTIVRAIDVRGTEGTVAVIPLEYASAEKTASSLAKFWESGVREQGKTAQTSLSIVPDERMNALIAYGEARDIERLRSIVVQIDRPSPRGQGNVRVYKLEHADATELADVLNGLVGKTTGSAAAGGQAPKESGVVTPVISSGVTILADKATNSLVITAGADDFTLIEELLRSLDTPRKQVLVEALIMEVSSTENVEFGSKLQGVVDVGIGGREGVAGGFSNPAGLSESVLNPGTVFGIGAAAIPVTINGVTYTNLNALIAAGKINSDFNIISTPQIMTLDNQEASITVAENRPYQTSQTSTLNDLNNIVTQFTYRDVGTILKLTPQINEGGMIKLKIFQEFSEVDQAATGVSTLPVTRKRTTETAVVIREGQTVVLSGLIGKSATNSSSRVPLLGDIPLLGWLFRYDTREERKTNLLVFITPRVVDSPEKAQDLYIAKLKEFERLQFDGDDRVLPVLMPLVSPGPRLDRVEDRAETRVPAEVR